MPDEFRVCFATVDDAVVISRHRARMFQDMGELPAHLFEAFHASSCDQLRYLLARGDYVGWLLSLESAPNKIIAGAGVHLRRVLPHPVENAATFAEGRHGTIVNVFTEPEWRRKGLAAMLLKQIIDWARDEKLDRLFLHASANARALYERRGFVATNEMRFAADRRRKRGSCLGPFAQLKQPRDCLLLWQPELDRRCGKVHSKMAGEQ